MADDIEHLRLISIFHYIVGGIMLLFSFMPLIHVGMGLLFILSPNTFSSNRGEQPPEFIGWLFLAIGGIFFLFGVSISICVILSGRYIAKRIRYMFSFVLACIECLFVPFGTALGVFTIIVLSRDSVKRIYGRTWGSGQAST
jgi:hypothetical protein